MCQSCAGLGLYQGQVAAAAVALAVLAQQS
jgi:hypothetical protein